MGRKFGELFRDSFEEYISKFNIIFKGFGAYFLIPSMVFFVLFFVFVVASFVPLLESQNLFSPDLSIFQNIFDNSIGTTAGIIFIVFGVLFVFSFLFLTLFYFMISLSSREEITFREVNEFGLKHFPRFIGLYFVLGIILFVGFSLLIIPGIVFGTFFLLSFFVMLYDGRNIFVSLLESFKLVKGRFWSVCGVLVLLGLVCILASVLGVLIPVIGIFLPVLVVQPFVIIFLKNLYFDLVAESNV